jgi:ornithine cyclodeaminase/alanine dehydrogenase-like protein (mu-crystallin family)
MQDALLLSRRDLEEVLDCASVIAALDAAFRSEGRGEWDTPKRIAARTQRGSLLAMPCGGGSPEALGAKLVSTFPGNTAAGVPSVSGLYALFDPSTGAPVCVMDGLYLTLVRTAAVSALATRLLSRPDAATLGLLGAGAQAESHARLIATVRPLERVVVWARRREGADSLVARLRGARELKGVSSFVVADAPGEAASCDIVVTATAAREPVLAGRSLGDGSHVNAIGAHTKDTREIDADAVARASVLAVETADTLAEAGDFQLAEAEIGGVVVRAQPLSLLLHEHRARDPRAITIFKSCGVAFEDLAVATLAWRRAASSGLGVRFSFHAGAKPA